MIVPRKVPNLFSTNVWTTGATLGYPQLVAPVFVPGGLCMVALPFRLAFHRFRFIRDTCKHARAAAPRKIFSCAANHFLRIHSKPGHRVTIRETLRPTSSPSATCESRPESQSTIVPAIYTDRGDLSSFVPVDLDRPFVQCAHHADRRLVRGRSRLGDRGTTERLVRRQLWQFWHPEPTANNSQYGRVQPSCEPAGRRLTASVKPEKNTTPLNARLWRREKRGKAVVRSGRLGQGNLVLRDLGGGGRSRSVG